MSRKLALIIGNTDYTDPGLAQLTAPGKDAEDFAHVLKSPDIAAFDDVKVLINENATIASEAIDEFFARKMPDDLLVLYFSGHGVRDEFGSLYLAVKNTNRDRLRSTAINSSFIREGMDQSRSRRQVLILDCCNSGAFAQGTKAEIGGSVGTATAFEGTGYGRIVLTASDTTQFAWEGNKVIGETDNSLFTHFLVKGLEGDADLDGDGRITIDELYDYTYGQIVNITPKQTPGKWSYKQQGEIVLRQSTRIEDIKPQPLPEDLVSEIDDIRPYVREVAVQKLGRILHGKNIAQARSAREVLESISANDDSFRVRQAATQVLEPIRQAEQLALKMAEQERLAQGREEAKQLAIQKADEDRVTHEEMQMVGADLGKADAELHTTQESKNDRVAVAPLVPINIKAAKFRTVISRPIIFSSIVATLVLGLASIGGYYAFQDVTTESTPTASVTIRPNTSTATVTQMPSKTKRSTSTPEVKTVSISVSQAKLYEGPGSGYQLANPYAYQRGDTFKVIAKDPSGFWFLTRAPDGKQGWLYKDWIDVTFNPLSVPTASNIPPVPPTPTRRAKSKH